MFISSEFWRSYLTSSKPWISLLLIAICVTLGHFSNRLSLKHIGNYRRSQRIMRNFFRLLRVSFYILTLLIIIELHGVSIRNAITGLGLTSIILGFALQDYMKDWLMGMNIIWDNHFSVDDVIKYEKFVGKVIGVTFRTTTILDINSGNKVMISNRNLLEVEKLNDWLDLRVPFSYKIGVRRQKELTSEMVKRINELDHVAYCEDVGTLDMGQSCITRLLRIHCEDMTKSAQLRRTAQDIILGTFEEYGIEVPYPQMDVHMK